MWQNRAVRLPLIECDLVQSFGRFIKMLSTEDPPSRGQLEAGVDHDGGNRRGDVIEQIGRAEA